MLSSNDAKVTAIPEAGAVIIFDTKHNIEVLRKAIAELDRPLETVVVQLENAHASDVQTALSRLVSSMGVVSAETQSNQVIIRETPGRVAELVDIAKKMDQPSTRVTREFRLKNAECSTVAQYLADMFGLVTGEQDENSVLRVETRQESVPATGAATTGTAGSAPAPEAGRRGRLRASQPTRGGMSAPFGSGRDMMRRFAMTATETQSGAAVGTAIADVRTNSVWITETKDRMEQIAEVINGLDAELATQSYKFSFVDPSELGLDEKLASVLLSPFDHYEVDQRTRTVSVTTTPERMTAIMARLKEWDAEPKQVFITGRVLVVNRDRLRDIGVSYNVMVSNMDENVKTEIETTGAFLPVIPATPKGSLRFGDITNDDFTVLLEALESDSTTRTLSSPRVRVVDGGEAVFFNTTEEPYTEVVVDGNTQTSTESVKFKSVGVTIQVAPTITSNRKIAMNVLLEVSSLQEIRGGIPVVSTSQMSAPVIVADGQPVIIGGLVTDQNLDAVDKVPLLGDIPLLGTLFRNTRKDRSQRELVLIIIPDIINPDSIETVKEPTFGSIEASLESEEYLLTREELKKRAQEAESATATESADIEAADAVMPDHPDEDNAAEPDASGQEALQVDEQALAQ
jgi:type II secretory pathway component GspD/PulD (secretin)